MNKPAGSVNTTGSVASIAAAWWALLYCRWRWYREGGCCTEDSKGLKFLWDSPQGVAGGFGTRVLLFLDCKQGRCGTVNCLQWYCYLFSRINYRKVFYGKEGEREIRNGHKLYYVDWQWALNGRQSIVHGWKPETGFLRHRWNKGYSEALLLYILALGSPTFPIPSAGYKKWTATFEWTNVYDTEYLYAGPLFIHQMSHVWIDLRLSWMSGISIRYRLLENAGGRRLSINVCNR